MCSAERHLPVTRVQDGFFFLAPPRSLGLYPVGLEEADKEKSSHPVTHVVCHNRNAGLQRLLSDNLLSHNTCAYVVDGTISKV